MNKQICSNRWFIWAIVFIVVVGVGLWGFIEYTSTTIDIESTENSVVFTVTVNKKIIGSEINEECIKEGEIMCNPLGCEECCQGLVERYVTYPMKNLANEIVCIEEMTQAICTRCGNGVCDNEEDWCICPSDCNKPNPEDLELYPSVHTSDWKIYRNEEYGFELKYPSFFSDLMLEDENTFKGYFQKNEGFEGFCEEIEVEILEKSLDGELHSTHGGTRVFKYSDQKQKWLLYSGDGGEPQKHDTVSGINFFFDRIQDLMVGIEFAWIESFAKDKTIKIRIERTCEGYEHKSNNETIFFILDTFKFID